MSSQDLSKVSIIDVESCGLHVGAYPIEVGICDLDLNVTSWLIKPPAAWDKWNWSFTSEKIHGISRDRLLSDGVDVGDVARVLNERLAGRIVVSDAASHDEKWLLTLFAEADVRMAFEVDLFEEVVVRASGGDFSIFDHSDDISEAVRGVFPYTHRAGPDALHLANVFKAMVDPKWLTEIGEIALKR